MIDEQQMVRTLLAEQLKVIAYIQSIVRRPELADDIFQDLSAMAMEKRHEIADDGHLRNWLRTSARLLALNALRRRHAEPVLLDQSTLDAIEWRWREQDAAEASAYTEHLRRCTARLSDAHRALIAKRFVDGYDYDRLAAECGRPVKSLYVTFSRIYASLGKCIADRMSVATEARHV